MADSAILPSPLAASSSQQQHVTCYRFGSVGEDTHICLWDMTEDMLRKASSSALSTSVTSTTAGEHNSSQTG